MTGTPAVVSKRAVRRWDHGHPWIYRSDVEERPSQAAGVVEVHDERHRPLGKALWSPTSEISLRLLDRTPDVVIDAEWWHARIERSEERRANLGRHTTAYRLVHGEADRCPSFICDRYDRWLVIQLMS